ncbi:MAG: hypothetical protein AB1813_15840 [Verrucomicrobiota bacterium]
MNSSIIFRTATCVSLAASSVALLISAPVATGTHHQWMRTEHTSAAGLSEPIHSIALLKENVFAAAGPGLFRLKTTQWEREPLVAHVSALFVPESGDILFAGSTNGVWLFEQSGWRKEENSPVRVIRFESEPGGAVWALAPDGVWRRDQGWQRVHTLDQDMMQPHDLLPFGPEDVWVASEGGLFGLMGKRKYWLSIEVRPGGLLSPHARALARLNRDHFVITTDQGLNLSNGGSGWQAITGQRGLPVTNLTEAVVSADGTLWLGSNEGLMRWRNGGWIYFASKRWLPDNRVTALAPGLDGSVWAGTSKGLAHIQQKEMTLESKSEILQRDLQARAGRHGYVTVKQLRAPGVVDGATQEISDNDGLWTALYIAAQSYRYAVTKSPEAQAQAWRSMQALLRLESITGISGFPARAICHVDEPQFDRRSARSHPEWHESPHEKGWYWKGETSSDELDGHYFGWLVFFNLAATPEQKKQVAATCKRVTDHILDHGYYLVDLDGKPTTWGVWAPEKLNDDPKWWAERGLNSLEMLSHLKVASHLVGEPRYEKAYQELIQKHRYALNTLEAKIPGGVSHDDQLLFLSYYPLLQLEKDSGLRAIYTSSLRRTWEAERVEANPLWNFIFGASTGESCDIEAAVQSLRDIPLDFVQWRMRNSHRADLAWEPDSTNDGKLRLTRPLSWIERPIHKWDKNPFVLDDGSDLAEGDQTIWLLPYWLGRYHRLID